MDGDRPAGQDRARPVDEAGQVVVTLTCPDRVGIVAAVAGFLASRGVNMVDCQQFSDTSTGRFFMRVQAQTPPGVGADALAEGLGAIAEHMEMSIAVHHAGERPRLLVLVSKLGHCLNDLLYRHRIGALRAEIAGVVSNHPDFGDLARSYGVPFHHLPVTPATREEQEGRILALVDDLGIDLVVLARYMQILSEATTERLSGKAINIHHSFLPSFKGARPYHQAHAKGVKLVGSTAHYVTADLDEGPIIEQETARVDHALTPEQLQAVGRDIECVVLARAVTWHLEHRVFVNGRRTVVLR